MNQTYECQKCSGAGFIRAFANIANGVCFSCGGVGKVSRKPAVKKIAPLNPALARDIETIKNADLSAMSYGRLNDLRNTAHWPTPHCPDLLEIWRERGDPHFFARQEERIAACNF